MYYCRCYYSILTLGVIVKDNAIGKEMNHLVYMARNAQYFWLRFWRFLYIHHV